MPDSRQLDILKRLTAHLQGITIDNGYEFEMSQAVFRGRMVYGEDDPVPMISIVEHLTADIAVETAGENDIMRQDNWVLLVQGWLSHEPDCPTDEAYQLKAATEHRLARLIKIDQSTGEPLYPDEYLLGIKDTITGISIGPGVVSVAIREGASAKAFFYLPVGISLAIDISDPFVA
jgi:hypothetical protein